VIQTFAENSLKHGILHLESSGRLAISVSKSIEGVIIEVEDNGIGRARAAELSEGSTGKGLAILKGYFDYYNRYNREKISFGIIDLVDAKGKASGTKVVIKIPDGFSFSEKE
jgi:LytS/YehU family sensor histidine kinase